MPVEAPARLRAAVDAVADGGSPDQPGAGGWDAEAVREYEEYCLTSQVDRLCEFYGAAATRELLRNELHRLGGNGTEASDVGRTA